MGLGGKLLVMLFSISIALLLFGYTLPDSENVPKYFGYDYNQTGDNLDTAGINNTTSGIIVESEVSQISAGGISFFDRFENVVGFIAGVFSFFAGPIAVLNYMEAPPSIVFLVGSIWAVLWAIAIVSFIWRKDL